LGGTGLVFKDFILSEFHIVIERWRSESMARAQLTTDRNKKKYYEHVLTGTETIAETLIHESTILNGRMFAQVTDSINASNNKNGNKNC